MKKGIKGPIGVHVTLTDPVENAMEANRIQLNTELPAYEQIARIKIYHEEFEKTPKRSIKRYLYQPK